MPNRMWCLLVFLLTLASCLIAQETRCESLPSNNAQSECLYSKLKKADADMQRAYAHAVSLNDPTQKEDGTQPPLAKTDRKFIRQNRQRVVQKLRESQRLWLQYRETACGAVDDTFMGGTMAGEAVPLCKIDLTEQRTKFLLVNFPE